MNPAAAIPAIVDGVGVILSCVATHCLTPKPQSAPIVPSPTYHYGDDEEWEDWDHPEPDYPEWTPDSERHTHPDKIDERMAMDCHSGSDCYEIGLSIDILIRQIKFRRFDYLHSGMDPMHIPRYLGLQSKLRFLVDVAKEKGCPYNPEADREKEAPITTPTSFY